MAITDFKPISAHFIHEKNGLFAKRYLTFPPSVGDELRFSGDRMFKVTLLVWVFDEEECPFPRLNIGIIEA